MINKRKNKKCQSEFEEDNIITQKSSDNQLESSKTQIKNEKECNSQQLFEEQTSNLLKNIKSNLIDSLNQSGEDGEDIIKCEENKEKTEKNEEVFKKKENDFQKKKEKIKIEEDFKNIKEKKKNINARLSKKFKKQKTEFINPETLEINEAIQKSKKTSHQNVKELPKSINFIIINNIRDKTTIKKSSQIIEQPTNNNTPNNVNTISNTNNLANVNNINIINNVANMINLNNANNNINNANNLANMINVNNANNNINNANNLANVNNINIINNVANMINLNNANNNINNANNLANWPNLNNINNLNFNDFNDFTLLLNNYDINEEDILNFEKISEICSNHPNRP